MPDESTARIIEVLKRECAELSEEKHFLAQKIKAFRKVENVQYFEKWNKLRNYFQEFKETSEKSMQMAKIENKFHKAAYYKTLMNTSNLMLALMDDFEGKKDESPGA